MTPHLAPKLNADLLKLIGVKYLEPLWPVPCGPLYVFFAVIEGEVLEPEDASEACDVGQVCNISGCNQDHNMLLLVFAGLQRGEVV